MRGIDGGWELEARTKALAMRVVRFVAELPKNKVADVLRYQLLRSGTSMGANYRELLAISAASGRTAKSNRNPRSAIRNSGV